MKAIWQGILLATAVLTAGCATGKLTYIKAGTTDVERKRDENECLRSQELPGGERLHCGAPVTNGSGMKMLCVGRSASAGGAVK